MKSAPAETAAETELLNQRHGSPIHLPKRMASICGGMKVQRHFTSTAAHPYDIALWEKRDVRVMSYAGGTPKVVSERLGVEVPAHWDENAVRITVDKYLFGSKPGNPEYETSLKHAFDRIANTYTVWGWTEGYFAELEDALTFNEELKHMLVNQMWAPNSPVWFNVGHWEQWRWGRPDLRAMFTGKGNPAYYAKPDAEGVLRAKAAEATYAAPQASACFLTEVNDSMENILDHLKTEGRIFSSGSGVGVNISSLRSSHEPIKGKGKSSGPLSFNRGWDRMAGAIKSGGKTRRAARMVLMFSDHPDIFDFVAAKRKQEDIAKIILRDHNVQVELRALARGKLINGTPAEKAASRMILALPVANDIQYSPHMDEFLYGETLSDQNANHSVSLKGDFWRAFLTKGETATRWVTNPNHIEKTYQPMDLLELMAAAVWENGEPGVHNNDWINLWNPVKEDGDITTSNPCSEYLHLNNTSCNLSSFNLFRFFNAATGEFDATNLRHAARLAMICADLNIERGGFPTPEIAEGTYRYRTTGIGYANLGGLLMALGIPYDSDDGRWIASQLTSLLTSACWEASAEMGRELGSYTAYDRTKGSLHQVLQLHRACHLVSTELGAGGGEQAEAVAESLYATHKTALPEAQGLTGRDALTAYLANFDKSCVVGATAKKLVMQTSRMATELWETVCAQNSYRNSFTSCLAPTGTISAPMGIYDQGTTSAEPDYTLVKYKQLSGGGSLKMFNSLALRGLRTQGYGENLVREGAFEVAGIDGLSVATQDATKAIEHLTWCPADEQCGPVRQAWLRAVRAQSISPADLVRKLEARKWDKDLSDDEKLILNGSSHIENVPWLKPQHLAAFDCSATNGDGKRFIHHFGHLKMLGAIQPYVSGASSKTVNLPESASVADIEESFVACHYLGIKCIAVFRAGSKANAVYFVDTPETRKLKAPYIWEQLLRETTAAMADVVAEASKPRQRKLKGRRISQTVKFQVNGHLKGFLTVGVYPDGTCGEVFGRLGQVGSFASSMFEAWCKGLSTALQFGVPLPDIIEDFRGMSFEPSGFSRVGDDSTDDRCDEIKSCSSVVDLTVKALAWLFPAENNHRLREMNCIPSCFPWTTPAATPSDIAITIVKPAATPAPEAATAKSTDLKSASLCPKCHSLGYIQDGKCKTCRNCGFKDGGCGE